MEKKSCSKCGCESNVLIQAEVEYQNVQLKAKYAQLCTTCFFLVVKTSERLSEEGLRKWLEKSE